MQKYLNKNHLQVRQKKMVTRNKYFLLFSAVFLFMFATSFASAWTFSGTVYNQEGIVMNNASINVSLYQNGFQYIGSNSTYTNSSGFFNLSVSENSGYQYKIVIKHYQDNASNYVDYVGAILPEFPLQAFQGGIATTFYLKPAGTLNITSVNATGSSGLFNYIIKDVATGYRVDANFDSFVSSASIVVPIENNYSIEIFPDNSMPVSYEWSNWGNASYSLGDAGNSTYNSTRRQLNKVFNTSIKFYRVTGHLFNTTGAPLTNLDNMSIIPFGLEAGNMIFLGRSSGMPYNMSSFQGETDIFNKVDGTFDMTIPGPTENANILFMASVNNSGSYLIGYRNMSINYTGPSSYEVNFTMYHAMGNSVQIVSQNNAANFSESVNNSIAEQTFNVTSVGVAVNQGLHIEASVDYTNFNATSFSMMVDPQNSGTFYLPLINDTGLTSINIYSHSFAPKTLTSLATANIIKMNNNISLNIFDPKTIGGSSSNVKMALMKSNYTCDQPGFSLTSPCFIDGQGATVSGNPLSAIIGGGKVNFIMGILSTGVIVKYINVNMIASGPPSALFDNAAVTSTSGGFSSAMRFGSLGPKIYDYAMVSMPYLPSQLDTSKPVTASIPDFYLDNASGVMDWRTPVWNTSVNGTNATMLAENYSHFAGDRLAWQTLMDNNICVTSKSLFNSTNPCYIDTVNHRIWLRIPHFSGIDPKITGSVTATSVPASTGGSSGGSSGGGSSTNSQIQSIDYKPTQNELRKGYSKLMYKDWEISFKVQNESHLFKVQNITKLTAGVILSSTPQEATLSVGQEKNFNLNGDEYYDVLVKLNSIDFTNSIYPKANFTIQGIHEKIVSSSGENASTTNKPNNDSLNESSHKIPNNNKESSLLWLWILIVAVVIVGIGFGYKKFKQ